MHEVKSISFNKEINDAEKKKGRTKREGKNLNRTGRRNKKKRRQK